jgi:hypothetical protein
MKTIRIILLLFAISTFTDTTFSQSLEGTVKGFYDNIENNVSENLHLFASPSSPIMVYGKDGRIQEDTYQHAEHWIRLAESVKQWKHVIDKMETLNSDGNISVVVVTGHTESWRTDFNSVITLSLINGRWKIVSYMQENHQ